MSGLRWILVVACVLGGLVSLEGFARAPAPEIRALWITRFEMRSPKQIDRFVQAAVSAHFNTLFVQVRGNGETLYASLLEPRSTLLKQATFDPLAYTLTKSHQAGLEVHAWVNVFYIWSKDGIPASKQHLIRAHPDWVTRSSSGVSSLLFSQARRRALGAEGVFLDPGVPAVQDHIVRLCQELATRYPIDGIHLDYFRYAGRGWGFHPLSRKTFEASYGIDPLVLFSKKDWVKKTWGEKSVEKFLTRWDRFRMNQLDVLLSRISAWVEVSRPTLKLSVAVLPDLSEARTEKGQAWDVWLKRGWVDFVVAMAYHPSENRVLHQVETIFKIPHERCVVVGLGAWQQTPSQLVRKVEKIRALSESSQGCRGFSMFSYDGMASSKQYFSYLRDHVFREPAMLPTFTWKPAVDLVEN